MRVGLALLAVVLAGGCRQTPERPAPPQQAQALPPIECPLRRKGINLDHTKPLAEVEKYIAFLERPDRARWQRPDEVVSQLGLAGNEVVADLGAGSGYFTFRLARKLPRGRVYAIDIDSGMLRHIYHRAMVDGVKNIEVVQSADDDPQVPAEVGLVFVCDVLHHVKARATFLSRLAAEVKPGTRLVVVEFKEGELPQGPPASVKITRRAMLEQLRSAGFELVKEHRELLPYQYLLELKARPATTPAGPR